MRILVASLILLFSSTLLANGLFEVSTRLVKAVFVTNRLLWSGTQNLETCDALRQCADIFEHVCQRNAFSAESLVLVRELRKLARVESAKHADVKEQFHGTRQALRVYLTALGQTGEGQARVVQLAKELATLKQDLRLFRSGLGEEAGKRPFSSAFRHLDKALAEFEELSKSPPFPKDPSQSPHQHQHR